MANMLLGSTNGHQVFGQNNRRQKFMSPSVVLPRIAWKSKPIRILLKKCMKKSKVIYMIVIKGIKIEQINRVDM